MTYLYLRVWDKAGQSVDIVPTEQTKIHIAVTNWICEKKDSIVHLGVVNGAAYFILASEIQSWITSTPETRERSDELFLLLSEESKAFNIAHGKWED